MAPRHSGPEVMRKVAVQTSVNHGHDATLRAEVYGGLSLKSRELHVGILGKEVGLFVEVCCCDRKKYPSCGNCREAEARDELTGGQVWVQSERYHYPD